MDYDELKRSIVLFVAIVLFVTHALGVGEEVADDDNTLI